MSYLVATYSETPEVAQFSTDSSVINDFESNPDPAGFFPDGATFGSASTPFEFVGQSIEPFGSGAAILFASSLESIAVVPDSFVVTQPPPSFFMGVEYAPTFFQTATIGTFGNFPDGSTLFTSSPLAVATAAGKPSPGLLEQEVNTISLIAGVYSVLGIIGAAPTGGVSLLWDFGEAATLIGAAWTTRTILSDPFDANYKSVYTPTFPTIPTISPDAAVSQTTANDANSAFGNLAKADADLQALFVSVNRYNSAIQSGDQFSANLQNAAINAYLSGSSFQLNAFAKGLTALSSDFQAANIDPSVTPQDVSDFVNTLKTQGFAAFPQQEQALFSSFGADATLDQTIINTVTSLDTTQLPSSLSFVSALQLEAQAVNKLAALYTTAPAVTDNDTSEQAALSLTIDNNTTAPISAASAGAVPFTVAGLDPEDSGSVTFSDGTNHVTVSVSGAQTNYNANLTTLSDGTITSTLSVNTDPSGNSFTPVTGNTVTLDTDRVTETPTLTVPSSLTVPAGGSVPVDLQLSIDSDDNALVTISGVPQGFETITADDGQPPISQHGANYTFAAADVNNGLTLFSNFRGGGQPVNTLTVTATNTTAGETATSASKTISVKDPSATMAQSLANPFSTPAETLAAPNSTSLTSLMTATSPPTTTLVHSS